MLRYAQLGNFALGTASWWLTAYCYRSCANLPVRAVYTSGRPSASDAGPGPWLAGRRGGIACLVSWSRLRHGTAVAWERRFTLDRCACSDLGPAHLQKTCGFRPSMSHCLAVRALPHTPTHRRLARPKGRHEKETGGRGGVGGGGEEEEKGEEAEEEEEEELQRRKREGGAT